MEKRPTDLKAFFLLKVLSRRGGTMRFIRWPLFDPLGNFFENKAAPFAGPSVSYENSFCSSLKIWRSLLFLERNKL